MSDRRMNRKTFLLFLVGIGLLGEPCTAATLFAGLSSSAEGVTFSEANGVDASGNAVVGRLGVDGDLRAFYWTTAGGLQIVEGTSQGWGISGNGEVIAGDGVNPVSGNSEPFRWSMANGLQFLGVPLGGPVALVPPHLQVMGARRLSYDGSIIVGQSGIAPNTSAFRWTEDAGVVPLDSTAVDFHLKFATGVSDDGQVVVGGAHGLGSYVAYRWSATGGMTLLDNFPETDIGYAFAVSADGKVVVGQSGTHAFRWTESTGMASLTSGIIVSPYSISPFASQAFSVTQAGDAIVGTTSDIATTGSQAFMWTEQFGIESLQSVLANRFGLATELAGWHLSEARAISPDGRAIVGVGINPSGNTEAWLVRLDRPVTAPEPASVALIFLAMGPWGLACRVRRRTDRI